MDAKQEDFKSDELIGKITSALKRADYFALKQVEAEFQSHIQSLQQLRELEIRNQARKQESNTTYSKDERTIDNKIKTHFCKEYKENNQDYISQLTSNEANDNAMKRVYVEYKEIYLYLRDLGTVDQVRVLFDRINLGFVASIDADISNSQQDKNSDLSIRLFNTVRHYMQFATREYLGDQLLSQMRKLESDETIKTPKQLVNRILQLAKKYLIKCMAKQYEEQFFVDLLDHCGVTNSPSQEFLFWLLFGSNGDDILQCKLTGKQLFNYLKAMTDEPHGVEVPWGPMGNFIACRFAAWINFTFITFFHQCKRDNIDQIKRSLISKQIVSPGINNKDNIRTGLHLLRLYQKQDDSWRETMVLFNSCVIHSSVVEWYFKTVEIDDEQVSMTQHTMIEFIKHVYELLCQISSVYYKVLLPKARTAYRTVDTKGSKLRQIANDYSNISLLQFARFREQTGGGNLLHYAIGQKEFKLINFLIVDCQFDTDLRLRLEDYESPNGTSLISPFDMVKNDKKLFQKFKENNILIPPTYRKTTANQLYQQLLEHNGKLRRAVQLSRAETFSLKNENEEFKQSAAQTTTRVEKDQQYCSLLMNVQNILSNLKQFEAVDHYELCLVYRLLLKSKNSKENKLARKIVFTYIDALGEYISGKNGNLLDQHRVVHYLLELKNFFLFETVTDILGDDEVVKISTFMENWMDSQDIGILETVRGKEEENNNNSTSDYDDRKQNVQRHKKTNSHKLLALMQLTVFGLACYTLSQSQFQLQAKEKFFSIKKDCESSPGFNALIKIKHKTKIDDTQLRQDVSLLGVQWDYDHQQWDAWYLNNSTKSTKMVFDPMDHFEDRYVKDLVAQAHLINQPFQEQIARIVKQSILGGRYIRAPVKTEGRVSQKSQIDYRNKRHPKAAHVLDLVRGSILFDNIEQLKNGIETFIKLVEDGKAGDVIKIIRIKNGYSKIPKWKTSKDALYADAKANVLFKHNDKTMICEIQFLFTICQQAKKLVHKYYSLERQLGLMIELQWRLARRSQEKSLAVYLTNLVEEGNYELLSHELSANPSNVQYFAEQWLYIFDKRDSPSNEYRSKELKLILSTVDNESKKQENPALFKDKFFNQASISPLKHFLSHPNDPKFYCNRLNHEDATGARTDVFRMLFLDLGVLDLYDEKEQLIQEVRKLNVVWVNGVLDELQKKNGIKNNM